MLKPCVFFKEVRNGSGKWQCRCSRDGSLHNHCSKRCPHFTPTIWEKIRMWRGKR